MREIKFYRCLKCGNIVFMTNDSGVVPSCCGMSMELLEPKTHDSGEEKHVPVYEWCKDKEECGASGAKEGSCCKLKVKIGSIPHPMEEEHHICFVALETTKGVQINHIGGKGCKMDKGAVAKFYCKPHHAKAIYAYCNLHGMWKRSLE